MLIELKIRRTGGSLYELPNGEGLPWTAYRFEPEVGLDAENPENNKKMPHVCEVTDPDHIRFFMGDPAWTPANATAAAEAAEIAPAPEPVDNGQPEIVDEVIPENATQAEPAAADEEDDPEIVLLEFGNSLNGVTDPGDANELRAYMEANYGVADDGGDDDPFRLLRKIKQLQADAANA